MRRCRVNKPGGGGGGRRSIRVWSLRHQEEVIELASVATLRSGAVAAWMMAGRLGVGERAFGGERREVRVVAGTMCGVGRFGPRGGA